MSGRALIIADVSTSDREQQSVESQEGDTCNMPSHRAQRGSERTITPQSHTGNAYQNRGEIIFNTTVNSDIKAVLLFTSVLICAYDGCSMCFRHSRAFQTECDLVI